MRTLYEGPMLRAELTPDEHAVWVTRSGLQTDDVSTHLAELEALRRALGGLTPWRMRLLFDTRAARGRNDLGFEQRVLVAFRELCEEFALVGVLVGTQIGRMHAERIAREHAPGYRVFTDLAEARRFAGLDPRKA